jgi:hypothetical protein
MKVFERNALLIRPTRSGKNLASTSLMQNSVDQGRRFASRNLIGKPGDVVGR